MQGELATSGALTCASGGGADLDYFIISPDLRHFVELTHIIAAAGTSPHSMVCLTHLSPSWSKELQQRRRPRKFPFIPTRRRGEEGCGPLAHSLPCAFLEPSWSWETSGDLGAMQLEAVYCEFMGNVEQALIEGFNIPEADQAAHRGRSRGLELRLRPLASVAAAHGQDRCTRLGESGWRALRKVVVDAVQASRKWWNGGLGDASYHAALGRLAAFKTSAPLLLDGLEATTQALADIIGGLGAAAFDVPRCTDILGQVKDQVEAHVARARKLRREAWGLWKHAAAQGGAKAAHAFNKGHAAQPKASAEASAEGHLAARLGFWLKHWLRDAWHEEAEVGGDDGDAVSAPLPRPSLEDFDTVCLSFKEAAGLGADCFHPRWILYLPEAWRTRYLDMLMLWEATASKPKTWLHTFVLLDKPTGGDRTIGLSVAPLRIWSKMRRPMAAAWEASHFDDFFYGCAGRPCEQAAWSLSVHAGAAQELGGAGAAFFLDVEKFYEMVQHPSALLQARLNDFPFRLMQLALASYRGWRTLQYNEAVAIPFRVAKTIVAGCSLATSLAKVLVRMPIRAALAMAPSMKIWNVVDDISGFIGGPRRLITHVLPVALDQIIVDIQRQGLRCSKGKSKAMCWGLGDAAAKFWVRLRALGIMPADVVRSVGVDVIGARARRVPILRQRIAAAATRARRHCAISLFDHRAAIVAAAGAKAAATWGVATQGMTAGDLRCLTTSLMRPVARMSAGQSPLLTMYARDLVSCLEPATAVHGIIIGCWASAVWAGWPSFAVLDAALRQARLRLLASANPWLASVDAASAFLLTCARIGWQVVSARCLIDAEGIGIDMLTVAPQTVANWGRDATENWSTPVASVGGCPSYVDWTPIRQVAKRPLSGIWTPWHRTAAVKIAAGGLLRKLGAGGFKPLCDCGRQYTPYHQLYQCHLLDQLRAQCAAPCLLAAAANITHEADKEAFARGRLPHADYAAPRPLGSASCPTLWTLRPEGDIILLPAGSAVYCDGSSKVLAGQRYAGWSFVVIGPAGGLCHAAYGPVPGDVCPRQSSRDAEDFAAMRATELILGEFRPRIDCAGTIGVINGARSAAVGGKEPRAHLWCRAFSAQPGLQADKCRGHARASEAATSPAAARDKVGNDEADRYAKLGRQLHETLSAHTGVEAAVLATRATARLALQWAAEAHVAMQKRRPHNPASGRTSKTRRRLQVACRAVAIRRSTRQQEQERPGEGTRPLALNRELQPGDPRIFRHHFLVKATVWDANHSPRGSLVYCAKCYRYYHQRFCGLAERCSCVANPSAASLIRRGLYPSGRVETRHWSIGPTVAISPAEGIRLGQQLCSAASYGAPAVPRPRRLLTKTTRGLSQLLAPAVIGQEFGQEWHLRRSKGEQLERVSAFLAGAGLTAETAAAIGVAERQRLCDLRAATKRKRSAGVCRPNAAATEAGTTPQEPPWVSPTQRCCKGGGDNSTRTPQRSR